MTDQEAFETVVFEGTAYDGMVVGVRGAADPGTKRVETLRDALILVRRSLRGAKALDRHLAGALYGLSYHLSGALDHWIERPEWQDTYIEILEQIEAIFEDSD